MMRTLAPTKANVMRIALLHTAEVHVASFDRQIERLRPGTATHHIVRSDLLARARASGLQAVQEETMAVLDGLGDADAVICTCSTLGPVADSAGAQVVRIDRPMMEQAVHHGPNVLVAICLESTRAPTLALLQDCAAAAGQQADPRLVLCSAAWPAFEAGDTETFGARIAEAIAAQIALNGRPDSIVLGQASMRVAEDRLAHHGVPVLASPRWAVQNAIALAGRQAAGNTL